MLECQPFIRYSDNTSTNTETEATKVQPNPSVVEEVEMDDFDQYMSMFEDEQSIDFG